MTSQKEARQRGLRIGYDIAEENSIGFFPGWEKFIDQCLDTELSHYRQFSPFEHIAAEFNRSRNPDEVWGAYNDGVYRGILKYLAEYAPRKDPRKPKKPNKRRK
jgi:hypothetical protein